MATEDEDSPVLIPASNFADFTECPICIDQITSATITTCGHRYCEACIHRWVSRHKRCPYCNEALTTAQLIKDRQYDSLIGLITSCSKGQGHLKDQPGAGLITSCSKGQGHLKDQPGAASRGLTTINTGLANQNQSDPIKSFDYGSLQISAHANRGMKEWQQRFTQDVRSYMVKKIVYAIFPTPDSAALQDRRMTHLIDYAKTVERYMYETANSRGEYYHFLAEKIYKVGKEIDEKRVARGLKPRGLAITRHLTAHTGGETSSCEICGKSFGHKMNLMAHRLTHF